MGVFIGSGIFQVGVRRVVIDILGILLRILRIIQELFVPVVRQFPARVLGELFIFHLVEQEGAVIHRRVDSLYHRLLVFVFRFPLGLGLVLIGQFHIGLVVVPVLLQPRNIRALIGIVPFGVLFAVDEAGVDPAMDHFVHAVISTDVIIARKRVNETAVLNGQRYVAFPGFDLAHAHIAAVCRFGQVDAVFCAGVDLGAVPIRGMDHIRSRNLNGLIGRADTALLTGQIDAAAFYCSTAARLGDIPFRGQGHVSKRRVLIERGGAVFALQFHNLHVPRQGLALQDAARGGDVDIPFARGHGAEPDVVRYGTASLSANRSDMDIPDIVFRRQVHNLALQGRIVKLRDAAGFGVHGQRSLVMGVGHIARQVDAAAAGVGALDVNFAHFRAKQPDRDGLGSAYGVTVSLEGFGAFIPPGIVVSEPAEESRLFHPSLRLGSPARQEIGSGIKAQRIPGQAGSAVLPNDSALGQTVLFVGRLLDYLCLAFQIRCIFCLHSAP